MLQRRGVERIPHVQESEVAGHSKMLFSAVVRVLQIQYASTQSQTMRLRYWLLRGQKTRPLFSLQLVVRHLLDPYHYFGQWQLRGHLNPKLRRVFLQLSVLLGFLHPLRPVMMLHSKKVASSVCCLQCLA